MGTLDGAVLPAQLADVLQGDIVTEIIERAVAALRPEQAARDAEALRREDATLATDLERLATAIGEGGILPTLLTAVKAKESRRAEIADQLARLAGNAPIGKLLNGLAGWNGLDGCCQ